MPPETRTTPVTRWGAEQWTAIVGAALVAGLVFGLMIQFMMGMMPMIGALYGSESALVGWIAHMVHSVVFAGLFAVVAGQTGWADRASSTGRWVGLGLGYGALVWFVAASVVMPVWLYTIGAIDGTMLPNINPQSIVGHLVFGLVLGLVYPQLLEVVE